MSSSESTIVVGIDFGTTYSGVAWAISSSPDQINIITNWNTSSYGNADKNKTPTEISYGPDGEPLSWGYDISAGENSLKWFKLLLLDEKDTSERVRQSDGWQRANKHVNEVISDYLRLLWGHCLENIQKDIGQGLMNMSRFKVVVTLPAIWPAYSQIRMKQAIEAAGILHGSRAGATTLGFISEPEAAALATMQDMTGRADMKKNDHFVVCDAGGGTVDIITYRIMRPKPLTVRESVKGDGGLCGATFLDGAFHRLMRQKLPKDILSKLGSNGMSRILSDDWENGIKMQFKNDLKPWHVRVPYVGTAASGAQPSEIRFERQDIFEVFRPVIEEIAALVRNQIDGVREGFKKPPKYIILVGGFGKSNFLYKSLQGLVRSKGLRTDILQSSGERPWTAVCRGAVVSGLGQTQLGRMAIDSRIARASYGTTCNVLPWTANDHDEKDKAWCPIQQNFLAVDQTQWFLKIKKELFADEEEIFSFFQDLVEPETEIVTELVYSEAATPPSRCDDSVKQLCKIVWSKVPNFEKLPAWTNSKGETFRQLCYDVRVVSEGASLDFEILHDNQVVASRNVQIDYRESGSALGARKRDD